MHEKGNENKKQTNAHTDYEMGQPRCCLGAIMANGSVCLSCVQCSALLTDASICKKGAEDGGIDLGDRVAVGERTPMAQTRAANYVFISSLLSIWSDI